MKKTVLIFILGLICECQTFAQVSPETARSVQSDSTDAGFILRTQDLFWQTGMHPVSLDRMSVMLDDKTYGRYGPQPEYTLDGIPFDPTFFGVTYTQLFPLPVHQIKSSLMQSSGGFGIRKGELYQSGLISIQSEPLKQGVSVFGTGQVGHNSGEPGPWVFDPDRVTPNVERFGPWLDGGIGLKFGKWYAKGIVKNHSYFHIDESVQTRIINLRGLPETGEFLNTKAETTLGLVETGIESEKVTIRLQAIGSESDEFLFFQPLAREVPTVMGIKQVSGLADFLITKNVGIRSLVQLSDRSLDYRLHRFTHNFDWNQTRALYRGSAYYKDGSADITLGVEYTDNDTKAPGLLWPESPVIKVFTKPELTFWEKVTAKSSLAVQSSDGSYTYSAAGSAVIRVSDNWSITIEGGYRELFPFQSNPVDFWVRHGYTLFEDLGIQTNFGNTIGDSQADLANSRNRFWGILNHVTISDELKLTVEVSRTDHLALHIPFQDALYDLPFSTQPGNYFLSEGERGSRLLGSVIVEHQVSGSIWQRAMLNINHTTDGNIAYQNYWNTTPDLLLQHSLQVKPYSDVELVLRTQYISERVWAEFERLDGELNRNFHIQFPHRFSEFTNRLPSHINIDLTLSKWFWQQRLRAAVQLKNILNRAWQTHPIGIREGFGYLARVEFRF